MNLRETRREFGTRFLQTASGALLLPPVEHLRIPEPQKLPFLPGECILSDDSNYILKQELGEPNFVKYKIPDFFEWFFDVGRSAITDHEGLLSSIKEKPVPPAGWVEHWDGSFKLREEDGGAKIIPIMGLGSFSQDKKYFGKLMGYLADIGYTEEHILNPTYNINRRKKTLGVDYDDTDSLRDPRKVVEDMSVLLDLWKKEYPLDMFWLIGHSNGGFLALELAKRHPDAVTGIITLDGALAGAKLPIAPEFIQSVGAKFLRGEAGEFHVKRGFSNDVKTQLEKDVDTLRRAMVKVITFSSTDDPFVPPECAFAKNSMFFFGNRKINTLFSMGTWTEWIPAKQVENEDCDIFDLACIFDDETVDSPSAQLKERPSETVGRHGAPLVHDQVLSDIRFILTTTTANDVIKKIRVGYDKLSKFFLKLPSGQIKQNTYMIRLKPYPFGAFQIILYDKMGEQDVDDFLKNYGVEERWWIPDLEIVYDKKYYDNS